MRRWSDGCRSRGTGRSAASLSLDHLWPADRRHDPAGSLLLPHGPGAIRGRGGRGCAGRVRLAKRPAPRAGGRVAGDRRSVRRLALWRRLVAVSVSGRLGGDGGGARTGTGYGRVAVLRSGQRILISAGQVHQPRAAVHVPCGAAPGFLSAPGGGDRLTPARHHAAGDGAVHRAGRGGGSSRPARGSADTAGGGGGFSRVWGGGRDGGGGGGPRGAGPPPPPRGSPGTRAGGSGGGGCPLLL